MVLNMSFKPSVPMQERARIVDYVRRELELSDSKWEAFREIIEDDEYDVIHVNWMSHIDEDLIEEVFNNIKPFLKDFSVSLYYLSESDYDFAWDSEEEEAK